MLHTVVWKIKKNTHNYYTYYLSINVKSKARKKKQYEKLTQYCCNILISKLIINNNK